MSHPAKTILIFGCYLIALGLGLLAAPNLILGFFRITPTTEVWIRVAGMLVFFLGLYYWVAARSEARLFFWWSVILRSSVILFFAIFAITKLAPPVLLLFGALDFAGALWTWRSLYKESFNHPPHAA